LGSSDDGKDGTETAEGEESVSATDFGRLSGGNLRPESACDGSDCAGGNGVKGEADGSMGTSAGPDDAESPAVSDDAGESAEIVASVGTGTDPMVAGMAPCAGEGGLAWR
jgi:hypothetical protein